MSMVMHTSNATPNNNLTRALWALWLLIFCAPVAFAHKPSDAFITVTVGTDFVSGQLDWAIKDLEFLMGVDSNRDLKVTWGELQRHQDDIYRYSAERLHIKSDVGDCLVTPNDFMVTNYSDGAYATVVFKAACANQSVKSLSINYDGLFDLDAQHRGLLNLSYQESFRTFVFTEQSRSFHFETYSGGYGEQLLLFIKEGLDHIVHGYDHLLFLIALVLPSVFFLERRRYKPHVSLRPVITDTLKVITAFTLAHTISLCLVTLQILLPPPSQVLESMVAGSVLLTALNNLFPVMKENRWLAGFGFGLIHGMAFASVLTDLGLSGWRLAVPLVGFNLGVELAQVIIVGAFVPLAFALRKTSFYRWVFLIGGSIVTAGLSTIWMIEQIFK